MQQPKIRKIIEYIRIITHILSMSYYIYVQYRKMHQSIYDKNSNTDRITIIFLEESSYDVNADL